MILFSIGFVAMILGVAGVEGTLPIWQGFLISFSGIVIMFVGVIRMAYQGSDYLG